jgi:HAD superfamily hydrolase (TIGR01509 family)
VRVDAVIFDMDGTLVDSSETVPAAYAAAIYELCGRRCTTDEVIAEYSAGPAAALLARFLRRPASEDDVACWLRHLAGRLSAMVVYPGVRFALGHLAACGLQMGVFTGATRQAAELQLEHGDLRFAFGAVVGSDEIAAVKPAPDGIYRVCELLNVSPSRTAYVGDAANDLHCARAAGAVSVAAAWGHLYERDVEAHLLATKPRELIELLTVDPSA